MKQAGYLFSAGITVSQFLPSSGPRGGTSLQTWDTCMSAIVYGCDASRAQKMFENWCLLPSEAQNAGANEIKRIVGAEFIEQLLTEAGGRPLDWAEISRRILEPSPTTQEAQTAEDFGAGYWVEVNAAVPPECSHLDMESLKRNLAEDIRSGLNWSPDNRFLFLVSILSPPKSALERAGEFDLGENNTNEAEEEKEQAKVPLDVVIVTLPEMREKEAAALVEARNSVVAGLLWRKFVATTRLASNEIFVSPCCSLIPAEKEGGIDER